MIRDSAEGMRLTLVIFLSVWWQIGLYGQCTQAMTSGSFQSQKEQLRSNTDNYSLLQQSITFAENNCLSASQVAEIALLFDNDKDRIEFCKRAFNNTVDKNNFYEVYNSFFYFSTVFQLHDHLKSQPESAPGKILARQSKESKTDKEASLLESFILPQHQFYFGPNGCGEPVNSEEFTNLMVSLKSVNGELDRLTKAKNISNTNCLSTDQTIRLSLQLSTENARLDYLKYAAPMVYDLHNFGYSMQALNFTASKNELAGVLGDKGQLADAIESEIPVNGPCLVSEAEFDEMRSTLAAQNFNSSKLAMAKQLIQSNCLNSEQITQIIKLFEFENSKLEVAKFAYDYVEDPKNFYKVNDAFSYSTSATKLNDYIQGK